MPQVTTSFDTDRSSNNDDVTVFLEAGKHVVRFEAEGYVSVAMDFDAAVGTRKELTPTWVKKEVAVGPTASASATTDVPPAGPRKEIVIGGAVLAGAGLLAGIATGIAGGVASNDATRQRDALLAQPGACLNEPLNPACSTLEAKRREQSVLSNVAVVSFLGAAALGIATGAYVLVTRPKPVATSVHIAPAANTTSAGVLVLGRF
jgi:hypothetical protein